MTVQDVQIEKQDRRSLAMKVAPDGVVVLIPQELEADSPRVRDFVEAGLLKLPAPESIPEPLTPDDVRQMVAGWSQRLGVGIKRTQIRAMRTKWASFSTAGTLTLSTDGLQLPHDLVDYIICHELIHLKIPDHGKGFQALMGCYIPDWRERELCLASWVLRS